MRKSLFVLFAAVTLFSLVSTSTTAQAACASDGDTTCDTGMSTSDDVHISRTSIVISLSDCDGFDLDAHTCSSRNETPYWTSSRSEIVSVNSSTGWVTPKQVGEAEITAHINGRTGSCEVEVTP